MDRLDRKIDISQLITGILSIIIGILVLRNPRIGIIGVALFLAIATIFQGFSMIYKNYRIKENSGKGDNLYLFGGLINILFGIGLLLSFKFKIISVPLIFSIWIIIESIIGIYRIFTITNSFSILTFISAVVFIIGLIAGIMLLKDSFVATMAVTYIIVLYFIVDGIKNIYLALKK